jgi:3-oxoacyl-[acyl-carrier protein] reductase
VLLRLHVGHAGASAHPAELLDALRADGFRVVGIDREVGPYILAAHVSSEAEVVAAVARAVAEGGGIDVLVNNAGILVEGGLAEMDLADLDRVLAVNVRGPFVVARAVLPHMPAGGRIVNVASKLAFLGRAGASAYAASKGAVLSMTRSWARELAPRILVNTVAPGPVDTPLHGFASMDPVAKALETANPLDRIGRPEEIAAVVAFLASPAASFMSSLHENPPRATPSRGSGSTAPPRCM